MVQATVTVTADVNILALHRMLAENGQWMVTVHNRNIVAMAKVPRGQPVESVVEVGADNGSNDSNDRAGGAPVSQPKVTVKIDELTV